MTELFVRMFFPRIVSTNRDGDGDGELALTSMSASTTFTTLRLYYEYDWSKTAELQLQRDPEDVPSADGIGRYSIEEINEFVGLRVTLNISNIFGNR